MSGLEKFENSEAWRNKLRNLLLKERDPQPQNFITETHRYSFDISEDLQKLIEEKKKLLEEKKSETKKMDVFENKENIGSNKDEHNQKVNFQVYNNCDNTLLGLASETPIKPEISDESFEAMELMCNKTASDPESTLFQYLHGNEQLEVMTAVKKRLSESDPLHSEEKDAECAAIDRLLNELQMTQIEDIEAPSRFWENDTILQTSPVKMVGLLRPSTILECAEISDVSSSQTSFKSALRAPLSEISSSYETASDTASFDVKKEQEAEPDLQTSVNLIDLENTIKETEIKENLIEFSFKAELDETARSFDRSGKIDFIDLTINADEDTNESDESVIEVLSDEEDANPVDLTQAPLMKFEAVNMSSVETAKSFKAEACDDQDLLSTSEVASENSLHFNDTLEEVEYMMKKGMEFMANGAVPKQSPFKVNPIPTTTMKSVQKNSAVMSPAKSVCNKEKKVSSPAAPSTAQKTLANSRCRFAVDIKPVPKFDLFKKPTSACKPAMNRQKDKFAHVISPIGTYIKKTPEAPLMSTVRDTKGQNMKSSSAFRELEFESRKYQPHFKASHGLGVAKLPKSPVTCSLQKKAYICSELRQVVDERNAVTIPGGKSIQKYLGSAVLPAVIQHDGKANLPNDSPTASNLPMKTHRTTTDGTDNSYANLSVVTGDISLYTIKDAQKF